MHQLFKKISLYLASLFLLMPLAFADVCSTNFIDASVKNTPITAVLCPVFKIFNIALISVSVLFAIYVIYAGVKLSLAWGDPKGFDSAKMSLTYSIIGFVIVLGFFTIFRLVMGIFGIGDSILPTDLFTNITSGVDTFNTLITK